MNNENNIDYSFYEKLIIIGDQQVGKTTFIESLWSLHTNKPIKKTLPTVNSKFHKKKYSFARNKN